MAIYATRWFARWANQQGLSKEFLCRAVREMRDGLYEAKLGRHLLKKRIARPGGGKSGGFRILVATNFGDLWVFLYGFAKSDQENLEPDEVGELRKWATAFVEMTPLERVKAEGVGEITRIDSDA
jgi:hypothetical protein